jgi:hypothetical protein
MANTGTDADSSQGNAGCKTIEESQITINCTYVATPDKWQRRQQQPRIVLNRFVVSFDANEESVMRVELTLTNEDTKPIREARTLNLAIDDDADHNYLRRDLPGVNLGTLAPGKSLTYIDLLRVGSFPSGHYTFHLWIPSADPSQKFNFENNWLLSSEGVPNPADGVNRLAEFTVRR